MNLNAEKDHDVEVEGKNKSVMLAKVGVDHAFPHADSCVGCRRLGYCSRCAMPLDRSKDRTQDLCSSGLCSGCCSRHHTHVDNDPKKVAAARTPQAWSTP